MAAGRRRGQKKAAGSRGPAPFTVVAFSAADYGSAEDAVEAARQVAAAAQAAAPGGQLFLALDCGGAEDWAPAFAPFVDIGAGGVALRALAAAPAVEPRHATRDQSLCVFGVVDEGGGVDEGRLLLRRGLFFQTGGVGVFVYWAALRGAPPRRRADRARLLVAAEAKAVDLLSEELLGPGARLKGAAVLGLFDWPGVRLARGLWGGGARTTFLGGSTQWAPDGGAAAGRWPSDVAPHLDEAAFEGGFRAAGLQVFPGAAPPPPPHREIRASSPLGAALGFQEEGSSGSSEASAPR